MGGVDGEPVLKEDAVLERLGPPDARDLRKPWADEGRSGVGEVVPEAFAGGEDGVHGLS